MRLSIRFLFALTFVALLVFVQGVAGQEVTAGIIGTVVDASGAPILGATATAKDLSRGTEWTAKSNETGTYNITRLPVGTYEVKVSAPGFQTAVKSAVTLVLNQTARLDVSMKVGQVAETVEVSSVQPLLETQTTELSTVIDARANEALPLATRNYNQLTLLAPGTVSTNPSAFTGPQASFQVGRPYVNGNREQTNNYMLDGMDNNQADNNDVAYAPSVDAIQEFNLITQNASAEFGNYLGGLVNVTLKSGTNNYHGSVFEFLRNDALNANTWANGLTIGQPAVPGKTDANGVGVKPLLRWNEFGGTFGGPILKDKLFFFADYQGSRFDQPGTTNNFGVFTTAQRRGDFSGVCTEGFVAGVCRNVAHQLFNPFSAGSPGARAPFLNNQIPAGLISRAASNILGSPLYPAPLTESLAQQSSNQFNFVHSSTNADQGDLKIDWNASGSDHVSGRYSQQSVRNPTTNSQVLLGDTLNTFPLQNLVVDWTRTISPSLVNDARVGYSYFPVTEGSSNPTGQNLGQQFGVNGVPDVFLPLITFGGAISPIGNNNLVQSFHDTVMKFEDTTTWTRGRHVFHTGFQAFHYRTNIFYPGNEGVAGNFGFTGQFTSNGTASVNGLGAADFLLGLPTTLGVGANAGNRYLQNNLFAAYGQDNWRLTDHLTLNLGLRWEVNTPRSETQDRITNYDPITGQVFLGNDAANYKQYNGITNFQPRLGIAWQPSWAENTVVRAAFGMSNFGESTGTGNLLFQNPPFTIAHNITNVGANLPTSTLDQGFSGFPASSCTPQAAAASSPQCFSGATIHLFDRNFRPAVSRQWNLTIQHQFGNSTTVQVGYVGQHVDHLVDIFLLNQKVLNPNGTTSPSPFLVGNPTLKNEIGQARLTASGAIQNYNGLQATVQQRLSRGLQFQANYTWSKCMTNSSGFFAEFGDINPGLTQAGNDYFFFQNTLDPRADYGRCANDVASLLNGYVTYDLPFGRGRTFGNSINPIVNAVLGDWQVNTIFNVHSGFAITAQAPDSSQTGSGFPRANCFGSPGQGSHNLVTVNGVTGLQWLDPSSVSVPATGTFGNCAVGSFRGPGLRTMDMSLSKFFPLTERQSIEFRAEAINLTNTPIFSRPIDSVSSSSAFGVVTGAQGERNIQFALKYRF
jgi:Carboxypeptidase regulatory-like domain/TonB dependent receptor